MTVRWRSVVLMDEPVPYRPTPQAELLGLRVRVDDLNEILRHLDRATMHLQAYCRSIDGTPDYYEWGMVLEMLEEVRDAYRLRKPVS